MKMENIIKGTFYKIKVEDLGEFNFLFSENKGINPDTKNYFMESYWNPDNYGRIDFIVGYYVDDIEDEIYKITKDISYFIDGAKISCECHMDDGSDDEGVYEGILATYFNYDFED